MITPDKIQEQIDKLSAEEASIKVQHERMVREHQNRTQQVQQIVNSNLNRLQQITGGISQLKMLLNGEKPPPEKETSNEPTNTGGDT